jgi:hypothetical protein
MLADPHLQPVEKAQLKPGDLVFPSTEHVQMYLGGGKIVEAPRTGLKVRVSTLGTFYAGRRVTAPAEGSYGGSPVSGTQPVSGHQVQSVTAQTVGSGLTNAFQSLLEPILKWSLWLGETGLGLVLIMGGLFLISSRSIGVVEQ